MSGDDLRYITNFLKYKKKDRLEFAKTKLKFYKFITDQKINLIFSTISLFDSVRKDNRKIIKNYVEIFINADIGTIIKKNKKELYKKKKKKFGELILNQNFLKTQALKLKMT